ncbi:cellulose-growth-specific protein [Lineolata rhizophorae]|uniref:AA9 family lytic polysaccharide monooxygenase n=1 Tax=Lineolata rhizophorae TaxID=578093 RepID=A0A6A6P334_9PEZI|nr:cellulose-growth-specific protein [Lineolata rhizophorae]
MKPSVALSIAFAACFNVATAHYRWTSLIVNDDVTSPYEYVRENSPNYNSPITDLSSDDLRCNEGTMAKAASTKVYDVKAGDTIGMALDQAIFHPGPILAYMSKAPGDVTEYDGSGEWFKVSELGPTFSSGQINWPASNRDRYTFTLPSETPSGQYLFRMEHIALHSAGAPQLYMSCAQVNVQGASSGSPGPTMELPGGYSMNDPGLKLNIYSPVPTSYDMPGPEVWEG